MILFIPDVRYAYFSGVCRRKLDRSCPSIDIKKDNFSATLASTELKLHAHACLFFNRTWNIECHMAKYPAQKRCLFLQSFVCRQKAFTIWDGFKIWEQSLLTAFLWRFYLEQIHWKKPLLSKSQNIRLVAEKIKTLWIAVFNPCWKVWEKRTHQRS